MLKNLQIALDEVGYIGKKSNKDLDSKTANIRGKWTKYARDLDNITGFYNGKKNGFDYCDVFVDWCMVRAYGAELAKKLLCQPARSLGAGTGYSARYYQQKGQYYKFPEVGDQIFFRYGIEIGHTGYVWKVTNSYVYTVEGNVNCAVVQRQYAKTNKVIDGYGRPNYSLVESLPDKPDDDQKEGKIMVELNTLRKGNINDEVKTVQALLIHKFGITCGRYGMDGDFGADTEKAVKSFQLRKHLDQDGVVGKKTWEALLGV